MIFFFDRTVGVRIPEALRLLRGLPFEVQYHQQLYAQDTPDDIWLPDVGKKNWVVVGQDYSYHLNETEIDAVQRYNIGCFYLWGSEAPQWEVFRCFIRAAERMVRLAEGPKPYIYVVRKNSSITPFSLTSPRRPFNRHRKEAPRKTRMLSSSHDAQDS